MAGWGMCGLLGAALAALGGRNVGRLTLAAVCGFAGIAYGALLNFSLMATYGGDLSLEHFLVLESRAVPFDAAHAIGNVAFALIAGPAMIRMLVPLPRALRVAARPALVAGAMLLALALASALPASAGAANAGSAASWLASVQNGDGGFGELARRRLRAPRPPAWVMLGLEAAGRNPLDVSRGGNTPVDYLRSKVGELEQQRRLRPHDPRPRGRRRSTRAPSAAATWSRRCSTGAATTAPTKAGRAARPSRSIALRAAGADRRPRQVAVLAGRRPERRRRLGRRARRAEQRRRDRRRDAGDARHEGRAAGPLLPAQAPARQRRLRARRRRASTPSRPPGRSRG